MSDVSLDQLADEMYEMVASTVGKRNLKPTDLTKAVREKHGVDRNTAKAALKQLIDSGRCVYSYFGGSYVTLPHKEGAANE